MKNIWIYTIPLLVLCLVTCLPFVLIFGVSWWRFLVFVTFNTALSFVINRSSRSTDDEDIYEVLISSFTYKNKEVEKDVDSCVNIDEEDHFYNHYHYDYDDGCMSAPDDDENKNTPHGVDENKGLAQYIDEEDHRHDYDDGCMSAPDDDENKNASHNGVDDNKGLAQYVDEEDHHDDGCTSAPDDDENKNAPHGVDDSKGSAQRVNDDLKRRSEEFIERGKQRWRDEKERDRDEMMNK
ncbi:hypothetical protein HanXRQr2_Chr13g0605811 [Helianthus annuus]|uniref:Uncharacterized protein n=1 Tax=Helianthus annuus TaxID=4232 RepID=A0A9K3EJK0_HELAN|nr:hypothetical protein HanXRQr2_Chr13g0605811 [Helianthus annuus]KAJ0850709.1 hypothetical protein HanPSC8_Chr13g0583991 [Helianthus annuus]